VLIFVQSGYAGMSLSNPLTTLVGPTITEVPVSTTPLRLVNLLSPS